MGEISKKGSGRNGSGGNGPGLVRAERLQIMLAPEELEVLDDFRFKWRMPSRAATVRELLRRGLAAEDSVGGSEDRRSQAFGVIEPEASAEV